MDRGAWGAAVHGVTESRTRLSRKRCSPNRVVSSVCWSVCSDVVPHNDIIVKCTISFYPSTEFLIIGAKQKEEIYEFAILGLVHLPGNRGSKYSLTCMRLEWPGSLWLARKGPRKGKLGCFMVHPQAQKVTLCQLYRSWVGEEDYNPKPSFINNGKNKKQKSSNVVWGLIKFKTNPLNAVAGFLCFTILSIDGKWNWLLYL